MNENINNAISNEVENATYSVEITKQNPLPNNILKQGLKEWVFAKDITIRSDAELDRLATFHKWRADKSAADKQKETNVTAINKLETNVTSIITNHYKKQFNKRL